jgi:hypothetical protein
MENPAFLSFDPGLIRAIFRREWSPYLPLSSCGKLSNPLSSSARRVLCANPRATVSCGLEPTTKTVHHPRYWHAPQYDPSGCSCHPSSSPPSLYCAFMFGLIYLLFTTFPAVFETTYHFATDISGLAYLGLGVGVIMHQHWAVCRSQRQATQAAARGNT